MVVQILVLAPVTNATILVPRSPTQALAIQFLVAVGPLILMVASIVVLFRVVNGNAVTAATT